MNLFTQEATPFPVQQTSTLLSENTETKEVASNVQRDQSVHLHQEQSAQVQLETFDDAPSPPTDTPFISYPVTKSPGRIKISKGFTLKGVMNWLFNFFYIVV